MQGMAEVVHVVGRVGAQSAPARGMVMLCGAWVDRPWAGQHEYMEVPGWFSRVTCEACKAVLAQEALEVSG